MSSNNTRCAACKYLRKKCPSDCIYSPYFPSNDPQRFENVHKIYGASNIARMLQVKFFYIFQITFFFRNHINFFAFSFMFLFM